MNERSMEYKGLDGIDYLSNSKHTIRDKVLVGIRLYIEEHITNIELKFSDEAYSDPSIVVELKNVKLFDFIHDEDRYNIEDYKLLYDEKKDEYYLSLDPYDYPALGGNDEDGGVITAKEIIVKQLTDK